MTKSLRIYKSLFLPQSARSAYVDPSSPHVSLIACVYPITYPIHILLSTVIGCYSLKICRVCLLPKRTWGKANRAWIDLIINEWLTIKLSLFFLNQDNIFFELGNLWRKLINFQIYVVSASLKPPAFLRSFKSIYHKYTRTDIIFIVAQQSHLHHNLVNLLHLKKKSSHLWNPNWI